MSIRGAGGDPAPLETLGRYAGPATLILSSLADGAKHGYALTKDVEAFAESHARLLDYRVVLDDQFEQHCPNYKMLGGKRTKIPIASLMR